MERGLKVMHVNSPTLKVTDIVIGERYRKDLGDIAALANSIRDVGLIQPLVVTSDLRLVAGRRRLEAVRELGWDEVPVNVVTGLDDELQAIRAEFTENTCRKDFTPSEAVRIAKAIEERERVQAKARQAHAGPNTGKGKKGSALGKLPEAVKGRTRDKVAEATGMSPRTYEKAKAVVDAADANPALLPILEEMDATGKVDRAFKKVQATKKPAPSPVAMKIPNGPIRGKPVAKAKQVPSGLHMQEGVYAFRAKVNASTFFGKSSVGLDIVATFLRQCPELAHHRWTPLSRPKKCRP
jgi:ParB-like chromosome segregation protein Spo0J